MWQMKLITFLFKEEECGRIFGLFFLVFILALMTDVGIILERFKYCIVRRLSIALSNM